MTAQDEMVAFMREHLDKELWREFLMLMDRLDTKAKQDIVKYARENGHLRSIYAVRDVYC